MASVCTDGGATKQQRVGEGPAQQGLPPPPGSAPNGTPSPGYGHYPPHPGYGPPPGFMPQMPYGHMPSPCVALLFSSHPGLLTVHKLLVHSCANLPAEVCRPCARCCRRRYGMPPPGFPPPYGMPPMRPPFGPPGHTTPPPGSMPPAGSMPQPAMLPSSGVQQQHAPQQQPLPGGQPPQLSAPVAAPLFPISGGPPEAEGRGPSPSPGATPECGFLGRPRNQACPCLQNAECSADGGLRCSRTVDVAAGAPSAGPQQQQMPPPPQQQQQLPLSLAPVQQPPPSLQSAPAVPDPALVWSDEAFSMVGQ